MKIGPEAQTEVVSSRIVWALGYHQVPADVIEDPEMLVAWARQSVAVALASHATKAKKAKKKVARAKPAKRSRSVSRRAPARGA